MYTDEQISKMKPKVHPAIKLSNKWNIALTEDEYTVALNKLEKWTEKEKAYIVKEYGKPAGDLFLKFVAPLEVIPFLKAGFSFNYDQLSSIIHSSTPKDYLPFLEQDLAVKLANVRENITTIALTTKALEALKSEFGSDISTIKQKGVEITKLANDSLILLAQGEMGEIKYLSKIEQVMKEDCKSDNIPTATYIKALKSVKKQINSSVYKQKENNITKKPEELTR